MPLGATFYERGTLFSLKRSKSATAKLNVTIKMIGYTFRFPFFFFFFFWGGGGGGGGGRVHFYLRRVNSIVLKTAKTLTGHSE